ncbi:CHAT domain-containing protein, partial [Anaerolineales bacterium HSG24]|nr:CHAT domain-containing protein [Anaerolineales bacterium HSG24]
SSLLVFSNIFPAFQIFKWWILTRLTTLVNIQLWLMAQTKTIAWHFEYEYDHQPPDSIMPFFITKMNGFIDQKQYALHGVDLRRNKIKAFVRLFGERFVHIDLLPDPFDLQTSREFGQEIRQRFGQIHQQFKGVRDKVRLSFNYEGTTLAYEMIENCLHGNEPIYEFPLMVGRKWVMVSVQKVLQWLGDWTHEEERQFRREKEIKNFKGRLESLSGTPRQRYEKLLDEANVQYKHADYTLARMAFIKVHEDVQRLRGRFLESEPQRYLSEQTADLYEKLVHCYLIEENYEAAFKYATTGKGRAFVQQLGKGNEAIMADMLAQGDTFAKKLAETLDLRTKINELETSPDRFQKPIGSDEKNLDDLLYDEDEAWRELESISTVLTAMLRVPQINIEEAQTLAHNLKATLIEFYQHATNQSSDDYGEGWCAFVIQDGGKNLNPQSSTPPSSIQYVSLPKLTDSLIQNLLNWIKGVELPTGTGRSKLSLSCLPELYQAAIAPLEKYLSPDKPIIMAPFAQLHLLPLSAARNRAGRYLADDYTVTFVPSLTALHVAHEQTKRRIHETEQAEARFTDADSPAMLSVAYPGQGEEYLPHVLYEAEAIAQCFQPSELLKDEQATPDEVIKQAQNKQVLHLSCHGEFDSDQPEQSGLALAGNQWLTIQQIITNLKLSQTQLVSLAACRSGQMDIRQGEEHVGLLQAMLTAGAETVIASLWRVDDAATFELFSSFYNHIAAQASPAQAMQQAMLMVRQRDYRQHPYYWAGFQVNGLAHQTIESAFRSAPQTDVSKLVNNMRQTRGDNSMNLDTMIDSANLLLKTMFENRTYLMSQLTESEQSTVKAELTRLAEKIAKIEIEDVEDVEEIEDVEDEDELWNVAHEIHCLVENIPALRAELMEELPPDVQVADRQQQRFKKKSIKVIKKKAEKKIYVAEKKAQTENHLNKLRQVLEATSYEQS